MEPKPDLLKMTKEELLAESERLDKAIQVALESKLKTCLDGYKPSPKLSPAYFKMQEQKMKLKVQKLEERLAKLEAKLNSQTLALLEPLTAAVYWDGQLVITKRAKGSYHSYLVRLQEPADEAFDS